MIHRQDAWTDREDRRLAEIVLEHIRSGSTQLKAFDEVGDELDRTSAACGFRWNALIRQKYEEEIKEAKRERKQRMRNRARNAAKKINTTKRMEKEITLDRVISYLEEIKTEMNNETSSPPKIEKEISDLKEKKEQLEQHMKQLKAQMEEMNKEYTKILSIMNQVRQLSIYEGGSHTPHVFKKETNGNLEKFSTS